MKLTVIGLGPVGLTTAAALTTWGHEVIGVDIDPRRVDGLEQGQVAFHEPGLPELVAAAVDSGRLRFTTDTAAALDTADVAFICVGTPSRPDGSPDLSFVERVGHAAARHGNGNLLLVEKSTVPAATGDRLERIIAMEQEGLADPARVEVASNPEFLREGSAVDDTLRPDRVVLGVPSAWAAEQLRAVYRTVIDQTGCPVVETDRTTAELIKHASNAFLATRLSFINSVARICDRVGADIDTVALGMGHDARIGHAFLKAGIGYGGSCFPKDVDAFAHLAAQVDEPFRILEEVRTVNHRMRQHVVDLLRQELWHLDGKTVAILGASFKPDTDDLREAPGMWLAEHLLAAGVQVRLSDPVALAAAAEALPEVTTVEDPLEACRGAHAVVLATEWPQHVAIEAQALVATLTWPVVIDGRNAWDAAALVAAGASYHGIGRGRY